MFSAFTKLWKVNTALNVRVNKHKLVLNGHGDGETKWKGCAWNILLVKLVILVLRVYNIFNNFLDKYFYLNFGYVVTCYFYKR